MARGGRREGAPGKVYSNRSDMNGAKPPVAKFQGETYGTQAQQIATQQALPATQAPAPIPSFTPLDAPTERPNEPVTHGLSVGPGAGPEALGLNGDDDLVMMRAAYSKFPNAALLRQILIEEDRRAA